MGVQGPTVLRVEQNWLKIIHFSMEMEIIIVTSGFTIHKEVRSAVKKVEFVHDRMWYKLLRGC
jgi:hypothetical protein